MIALVEATSVVKSTWCARINYALLTDHDKSYTGLILKIYELIFE